MPIDPVCGMSVHALFAVAEYEYAGRRYFFCSQKCHAAFVREPTRYLTADDETRAPWHDPPPPPADAHPPAGGCCFV